MDLNLELLELVENSMLFGVSHIWQQNLLQGKILNEWNMCQT